MAKHPRQHRGNLDHPRDRSPEEMSEPLPCAHMMFDKCVLAVLSKPFGGFGLGQSRCIGGRWYRGGGFCRDLVHHAVLRPVQGTSG
jgi:hypothetical protein